jgi:putative protease
MTYSGRCLLSNFLAERGANQGSCAHSCRWGYKLKIKLKDNSEHEIEINQDNKELFDFFLEEEIRPGQLLPFEEDVSGSYILNAKDLCLLPKIDQYIDLGIDSFKVEGRNKTEFYAGLVARIYRAAIDDYLKDKSNWNYENYIDELNSISNRGYSLAFHDGRLTNLAHDYDTTSSISYYEYAGRIVDWQEDDLIFEAKNMLAIKDVLEFISPYQRQPILLRIYEFICAKTGNISTKIHAGTKPHIRINASLFHLIDKDQLKKLLPINSLIRKEKPNLESQKLKIDQRNLSLKLESGDNIDDKYQ